MHRTTRAAAFGLALALIIPGAALAAPVVIPETITINSTLTVTGLPASINYGAAEAGVTTGFQVVNSTVSSNGTWGLTVSGSDFSGLDFPMNARECTFTVTSGPATLAPTANTWTKFGNGVCNGTTAVATGTSGTVVLITQLRVVVPAAVLPGVKTGTVTFTFTAGA